MNQVTRSRYGKRLPVTMTKDVWDPRSLKHPPGMIPSVHEFYILTYGAVDLEKKREIQRRMEDARRNLQDSEAQVTRAEEKLKAIEASMKEVSDAKKGLQSRKNAVLDAQKKLQSLKLKIGESLRRKRV